MLRLLHPGDNVRSHFDWLRAVADFGDVLADQTATAKPFFALCAVKNLIIVQCPNDGVTPIQIFGKGFVVVLPNIGNVGTEFASRLTCVRASGQTGRILNAVRCSRLWRGRVTPL